MTLPYIFSLRSAAYPSQSAVFEVTQIPQGTVVGQNYIVQFQNEDGDDISADVNKYFTSYMSQSMSDATQSQVWWYERETVGSGQKYTWKPSQSFAWAWGSPDGTWRVFSQSGIPNPARTERYLFVRSHYEERVELQKAVKRIFKRSRKDYGL